MKKEKKIVKGFKAFDKGLVCRGFQYELGKDFTTDEDIELCNRGFHFCENLGDIYSCCPFGSEVAEIEAFGDVIKEEGGNRSVTNGIRIIRILGIESEARANASSSSSGYLNVGIWNTGSWNAGNRNAGSWNAGSWNAGDWNTGDMNTGSWNAGDWNTGDWNTGSWNTGFFNTITPKEILIFNKLCKKEDWDNAKKPNFIYFDLIKWIEFSHMTNKEKKENPSAKINGGYLKKTDYKKAFQKSFKNASKSDIELLKKLPNFDSKVFFEISGIKIK